MVIIITTTTTTQIELYLEHIHLFKYTIVQYTKLNMGKRIVMDNPQREQVVSIVMHGHKEYCTFILILYNSTSILEIIHAHGDLSIPA